MMVSKRLILEQRAGRCEGRPGSRRGGFGTLARNGSLKQSPICRYDGRATEWLRTWERGAYSLLEQEALCDI